MEPIRIKSSTYFLGSPLFFAVIFCLFLSHLSRLLSGRIKNPSSHMRKNTRKNYLSKFRRHSLSSKHTRNLVPFNKRFYTPNIHSLLHFMQLKLEFSIYNLLNENAYLILNLTIMKYFWHKRDVHVQVQKYDASTTAFYCNLFIKASLRFRKASHNTWVSLFFHQQEIQTGSNFSKWLYHSSEIA